MKILFFDIDGTLTNEKTGMIPKSTKQAIKQAQANGHLVFINTGRPRSSIEKKIIDLKPDGYVCGCGSYIEYHGEVLLKSTLPKKQCQEIVNVLKENHISAVLEGADSLYFDIHNIHPIIDEIKRNYELVGFDVSKTWEDENIQFDKATCWLNQTSQAEPFLDYMQQSFEVIVRGEGFYECIQPQYSKATAIEYLIHYFNLSLDDAYAFGDSTNDLSMLTYVKHSIAMKEGHPDVLKAVNFVTKAVDEDGIEYALKHFEII